MDSKGQKYKDFSKELLEKCGLCDSKYLNLEKVQEGIATLVEQHVSIRKNITDEKIHKWIERHRKYSWFEDLYKDAPHERFVRECISSKATDINIKIYDLLCPYKREYANENTDARDEREYLAFDMIEEFVEKNSKE